jgi:hypothetical protein
LSPGAAAARSRAALAATNGQEEEFSLEDVSGADEETFVLWKGKKLKVRYNRDAIPYKRWKQLQAQVRKAQEDPESADADWIITTLCLMLTSWDLVGKKGSRQPLPITAETLAELPLNFLGAILEAIREETLPNAETAAAIDSGSSF